MKEKRPSPDPAKRKRSPGNRTKKAEDNHDFDQGTEKSGFEETFSENIQTTIQQTNRLRALANELVNAEKRERNRLAEMLHHNIQPLIVSARMLLWELKRTGDPGDRFLEIVDKAESILEEALHDLHTLTMHLPPPVLKSEGLNGALNWLRTTMKTNYDFQVNLYAENSVEPKSEEITAVVFDCVKELLFNVFKHSGTREADVALSGRPGEWIKMVVTDRGRGFDRAAIQKQDPERITFGLFSIQERLAYIGGKMDVESAPGSGAKITILVPAAKSPDRKGHATAGNLKGTGAANETIDISGKKKLISVLIVDDHEVLREGLKGMLQLEPDIEVAGEACSGRQAVEQAEKLQPDVIIMDVNLGDRDGVTVTGDILSAHPRINIIGLSMYDDEIIAAAMKSAGACAYLPKSGPGQELIDTIRKCV